jgi:NTE family protein
VVSTATVGLALSSGGARGAAHVGVLKVLEEEGIVPDVIAGASMGAQLGGAYAAGVPIHELENLWQTTSLGRVAKNLLPTVPWSGWSSGNAMRRFLRELLGDCSIEDLPIPFAAIATDLETGLPVSLTRGSLVEAIRASLSVPGLFTPVWINQHLCIDGGVSNPLPVDVARELGADVVIAVDVLVEPSEVKLTGLPAVDFKERSLGIAKGFDLPFVEPRRYAPSVFSVLFQMSTVFQKRLCDARLVQHPPDVLLRPDFSEDPPCYSRVGCGLAAGELAAREALPEIRRVLAR